MRRWMVGGIAAAVLAVVIVYVTTDDPNVSHSSALNVVFDARWLIAGARVLVGAAVIYLLASIGVRMARGQWVRSAGPVAADAVDPAQALADSQERLEERLESSLAVIQHLSNEVSDLVGIVQSLGASVDDSRPSDWVETQAEEGDANGANAAGDRPSTA